MRKPRHWWGIRHARFLVWQALYNHYWRQCLPKHSLVAWSWEAHLDAIWKGDV